MVPASYHGDVTINGEPADTGVIIVAEIDGEVRGSITVDEEGEYGSETAADGGLQVDGEHSEDGEAEVTFYVEGENFDRTAVESTTVEDVTWETNDIKQVDLTADVDIDDGMPGFGLSTALVALIAAALVATRRRN